MKIRFLLIITMLFTYNLSHGQLLKKLKKKAEQAAERKLEEKVEKETSRTMDSVLNPSKKTKKQESPDSSESESEQPNKKVLVRGGSGNNPPSNENENTSPSNGDGSSQNEQTSNINHQPWAKYNFVPGDHIIFEDDLTVEESGEFPSRWDLFQGTAENASLGSNNIINFENRAIITPLMDKDDYLPEAFTIEFDAYFEDVPGTWQSYRLRFWEGQHHLSVSREENYHPLHIQNNGAKFQIRAKGKDRKYNGEGDQFKENIPGWRHVAIAFNKRTLKVFLDQHRVLNIPNLNLKPAIVSIEGYSYRDGIRAIKNIRIAEGGKKLYDRVMSEGKFVTRGILFDVNKASIKKESMGVLNQVAKMMNQHADMNFRIEGHTDGDGANDYNLQLSQKRADAVKAALISLGIDASRLQTKGMGETAPVADNSTAEGKANNRRVEFIKL
ncbi:OmpA family protein [Seonamhaeicola maritimus]|uniref:OmpA family protein n=1 Tax=Seonamhaeicola maritimus TaxID=2591822 RepID=UPI002493F033|nr:OmpA family protein [Seonamhaeicola maritimus]